jgi:hypothetical protein
LGFEVQVRGPDAMHTLAGEVKSCFAMLGGESYTGPNANAQAVKTFEAETNRRYTLAQVRVHPQLLIYLSVQSFVFHRCCHLY